MTIDFNHPTTQAVSLVIVLLLIGLIGFGIYQYTEEVKTKKALQSEISTLSGYVSKNSAAASAKEREQDKQLDVCLDRANNMLEAMSSAKTVEQAQLVISIRDKERDECYRRYNN